MLERKHAKYILITLIFILAVVAAYLIGKKPGRPTTSPTPTPTTTPAASPKPTATPISTQGTLSATFTTNAGGPANKKVPLANQPLIIYRRSDGKLILGVMTDKDGKIVVKLNPGDYYITSSQISYFGQVNFSIFSNQITVLTRYIPSPNPKL